MDVEYAMLERVASFNTLRLPRALGFFPQRCR
jgi:hypothetical protein